MELSDMKPTRIAIPAGNTTSPRRQRGVVLFVALIVMVAMSLAAIALIRSVDTTNAIIGNLAFRMASILPANASIEQAASALFSDADIGDIVHIPDKTINVPAENYYACRQGLPLCGGPAEDARGVPLVLQKYSTASTLPKQFDANETTTAAINTHVTYLIERMCLATGPATIDNCDLAQPKPNPGDTLGDINFGVATSVPIYRVTVRVDGPKNTASFVQAMLK
jgi:type IV pilus assembly protein PilX